MITDISKVGNVLQIKVGAKDPVFYGSPKVRYSFKNNLLNLMVNGLYGPDSYIIDLIDLTVSGVAPGDIDAAITALSTVFPNAGGTATPTYTDESFLGSIYSKSAWDDLNDFTSTADAAISGSSILFNSGNANFTKRISYKRESCLEKWLISAKVLLNNTGTANGGVGIGLQSTVDVGAYRCNVMVKFDTSSGENAGKLIIYAGDDTYSSATIISDVAIEFAVSDILTLSLERRYELMIGRVMSDNGEMCEVQFTFDYLDNAPYRPNRGNYSVYALGGAFALQGFSVLSNEVKNAKCAVIGDSKGSGTGATDFFTRISTLLNNNFNTTITLAGPGEQITDMLARIDEIIQLAPKRVFLAGIGSNDVRNGRSMDDVEADYSSLTSRLTAAGIKVFHLTPFIEESLDQTDLYNFITGNFNAATVIDVTTELQKYGTGVVNQDSYHLNDTGQAIVVAMIRNSPAIDFANWKGKNVDYLANQKRYIQKADFKISGGGSVLNDQLFTEIGDDYFGSPTIHSRGLLYHKADGNYTVFRGGVGPDNFVVLQIETDPASAQTTMHIRAFNNGGGSANVPFYLYTTGSSDSQAGDIVIAAGTFYYDPTAVLGAFDVKTQSGGYLDMQNAKGFKPTRLTTTDRLALAPDESTTVYDITLHKMFTYDGTTWQAHW